MITTAKAFVTSDQKTHATLPDAQQHELELLLTPAGFGEETPSICQHLVQMSDKVVDILTTTSRSKVRARKVNGGTKKRKAAPDQTAVNRELQDGKQ